MSRAYSPEGKQTAECLIRGGEDKLEEVRKEKQEEWAKSCEILVKNPIFREWFTKIMLEHGGIEMDRAMSDIAQGQYIMLSKLRDSLKSAPSAPKFFGEIMTKQYELLRCCVRGD